jgi:hypothetical protein
MNVASWFRTPTVARPAPEPPPTTAVPDRAALIVRLTRERATWPVEAARLGRELEQARTHEAACERALAEAREARAAA